MRSAIPGLQRMILASALGALILVFGTAAIGAAGEGDWSRAWIAASISLGAAAAGLVTFAVAPSRFRPRDRMVFTAATGGFPAVLVVLAFLYAWGSVFVGDWPAAAFSTVVLAAAAGVSALAYGLYRRTAVRIVSPFRRFEDTSFRDVPDPPAYPRPQRSPREMKATVRPGAIRRLLRAIGFDPSRFGGE